MRARKTASRLAHALHPFLWLLRKTADAPDAACVLQAVQDRKLFVHEDFEPGFTSITLPYEFLPLPEKGTVGKALSRSGEILCDAEIVSVKSAGVFDHTLF